MKFLTLFALFLSLFVSNVEAKVKIEKTMLLIKPDVVLEKMLYKIISRVEREDLEILYMKQMVMDKNQTKKFYIKHKGKDYYNELVNSIAGKKIYVLMIKGEDAVHKMKDILGNKDPVLAAKGTIRKELGRTKIHNVAQSSKSEADAEDDFKLFFFDVNYMY